MMERGGGVGIMAAAKRHTGEVQVGLGMPGAWTQRRIAFHASSTYDSAPLMEPLNDPVVVSSSMTAGEVTGGGQQQQLLNKLNSKQNAQRLPSSMPLQWPTAQKIGAGLSNLGNTCFLNSVLQCLTYTPPLAGYCQSGQHKSSCRVPGFCAFCALQEHVSQALTASGRVVAPNKFAKNLRSISRSFRMCRQEDAHEYMRYLLEALHKCCIPPELATSSNSNSKPSQDKSLVYKIFGGRLRSQVKCSVCSHCSNTYDPFLDLSLDIVRADSLTKALTRFTAVDTLDGDNKYRCAHCKKKVRAQKQFTIETVPNIMTIQFKRFSSTGSVGGKIDKKVEFGTTLDMKPFSSSQDSNLKYRLYGVLVHSGWSTHSGHYYCFVRTSSDIWHVLDDSRVRQVSERTVLEQKAYMLFYVREVKREPTAPEQIPPKTPSVPAPAPAPAPSVIAAPPKEIKNLSGFANSIPNGTSDVVANGASKLTSNDVVIASANGVKHDAEVLTKQSLNPKESSVKPPPAVAIVPPPLSSEGPSSTGVPTQPVPCTETKDTNDKMSEVENDCTVSGTEVEADWDEHYKSTSGVMMASGSSQSLLRLLRAMPRTRRYFLARAIRGANKSPLVQTGHVSFEPSTPARKDGKRRLSANAEVPGNKRQQKDSESGVTAVVSAVSEEAPQKLDHLNSIDQLDHRNNGIASTVQVKDNQAAVVDSSKVSAATDASGLRVEVNDLPATGVENGGGKVNTSNADHTEEPLGRREEHHSGAELRGDRNDGASCQPMETDIGAPREHSLANGMSNENVTNSMKGSNGSNGTNGAIGSSHLTLTNNLYGVGVPRWNEDEGIDKEVDRLLKESDKVPTSKLDFWDAEYDRGRSKKVRKKAGDFDSTEIPTDRSNGSLKSDNPFQAFGSSKVGNGVNNGHANGNGNGKHIGNGSGNGSRGGKHVGVGSQNGKRRFD